MWGLPTFSKIFQRKWGSQTHSLPVCVSGKGPSDPRRGKLDPMSHSPGIRPQPSGMMKCAERHKGVSQRRSQHPWGPSFPLEASLGTIPSPGAMAGPSPPSPSSTCIVWCPFLVWSSSQFSPRSPDGGMFLSLDPTPSDCALRIPKALFPTTSCSWPSERTVGSVSKGHGERGEARPRGCSRGWREPRGSAGKGARGLGPRGCRVGEEHHRCSPRASWCLLAPSLRSFLSAHQCPRSAEVLPVTHALSKISSPNGKRTRPANIYICRKCSYIYVHIYIYERVMNSRIIKFLLLSFRAHCNLNSNNRKSTG